MNTIIKSAILGLAFVAGYAQLYADSYTVTVPGGCVGGCKEFVAYSFAATNLETALGVVPAGTMVYKYNVTLQQWDANTWDDIENTWASPNWMLYPGEGFFINNNTGTNRDFVIYGRALTNSSHDMSLSGNVWNAVGSAYPLDLWGGNFIECIWQGNCHYTVNSLNYVADVGDNLFMWDSASQSWYSEVRTNAANGDTLWIGEGACVSPTIAFSWQRPKGRGFFLKPVNSKTWTHLQNGSSCAR